MFGGPLIAHTENTRQKMSSSVTSSPSFSSSERGEEEDLYVDPRNKLPDGLYALTSKQNERLSQITPVNNFFAPHTRCVREWRTPYDTPLHLKQDIAIAIELTLLFYSSHDETTPQWKIYILPLLQWVAMFYQHVEPTREFPGRRPHYYGLDSLPPQKEEEDPVYRDLYDQQTPPVSHSYVMIYKATMEPKPELRGRQRALSDHMNHECRGAYFTFPMLGPPLGDFLYTKKDARGIPNVAEGMFRICQEMLTTIFTLHQNDITHGALDLSSWQLGFDQNGVAHAYLCRLSHAHDFTDQKDSLRHVHEQAYDIALITHLVCEIFQVAVSWFKHINPEAYSEYYPLMSDAFEKETRYAKEKSNKVKFTLTEDEIINFSLSKIVNAVNKRFGRFISKLHKIEYNPNLLDWWPLADPHTWYVDPNNRVKGNVYLLTDRETDRLIHTTNVSGYFYRPDLQLVREWVTGFNTRPYMDENHNAYTDIEMMELVTKLFYESHKDDQDHRRKIYVVPLVQWITMMRKRGSSEFLAFDSIQEGDVPEDPHDERPRHRQMYDKHNKTSDDQVTPVHHNYTVKYEAKLQESLFSEGYECRSMYLTFPMMTHNLGHFLNTKLEGGRKKNTAHGVFRMCQQMLVTIYVLHNYYVTHGDLDSGCWKVGFDQHDQIHMYLHEFSHAFYHYHRDMDDVSSQPMFIDEKAYDIAAMAVLMSRVFDTIVSWYEETRTTTTTTATTTTTSSTEMLFFRKEGLYYRDKIQKPTRHTKQTEGVTYVVSDEDIKNFSLFEVAKIIHEQFVTFITKLEGKEYKLDIGEWWPGIVENNSIFTHRKRIQFLRERQQAVNSVNENTGQPTFEVSDIDSTLTVATKTTIYDELNKYMIMIEDGKESRQVTENIYAFRAEFPLGVQLWFDDLQAMLQIITVVGGSTRLKDQRRFIRHIAYDALVNYYTFSKLHLKPDMEEIEHIRSTLDEEQESLLDIMLNKINGRFYFLRTQEKDVF
jgi:hypothetical protein